MKLLLVILTAGLAFAQTKDSAPRAPVSFTVATLPAAASWSGYTVVVTDAATAGSCTSGGGSALAYCWSSGSAWVSLGGGGTTYTAGPSGALSIVGSVIDITSYVPGVSVAATITGPWTFAGATSTAPMKVATSDPASCTVGDFLYRSDTEVVKRCRATNTWAALSSTSYITLPFWSSNSGGNPADATTYYVGCLAREIETVGGSRPCYVPIAATLIAVYSGTYQFGAGSSETSTVSIRKNDTTDTTVCSTLNNSTARSTCNATGLSVSYSAGDFFEIKWVTPTWATNPTAVGVQGVALFSVP